jgi:hypothetical protein
MRAMRDLIPRDPRESNPYESLERVQDDQAIRKARTLHRQALAARKRMFVLSMVLIGIGFVLQLIGAWPGCCMPWITPQA